MADQVRLGVGQQHRQLGPDEAGAGLRRTRISSASGRASTGAVQPAGLLQVLDKRLVGVELPGAARHGPGEGGDAVIDLAQHLAAATSGSTMAR